MKKKNKKALFDPRLPGAKMIFYGAILLIAAGCINAFFSWVFVVGTYGGLTTVGEIRKVARVLIADEARETERRLSTYYYNI